VIYIDNNNKCFPLFGKDLEVRVALVRRRMQKERAVVAVVVAGVRTHCNDPLSVDRIMVTIPIATVMEMRVLVRVLVLQVWQNEVVVLKTTQLTLQQQESEDLKYVFHPKRKTKDCV
jgi:hypothetical protein